MLPARINSEPIKIFEISLSSLNASTSFSKQTKKKKIAVVQYVHIKSNVYNDIMKHVYKSYQKTKFMNGHTLLSTIF